MQIFSNFFEFLNPFKLFFTKNKDFMIKILVAFQKLDLSNHGSFGLYALITLLGLNSDFYLFTVQGKDPCSKCLHLAEKREGQGHSLLRQPIATYILSRYICKTNAFTVRLTAESLISDHFKH